MLKQVPKSERIARLVARAYGDEEVRLDDLAIFEAVATNTRPLRKRGTIFEGARLQEDTLREMVEALDRGEHVPLQTMHRRGIPVGKVFAAETRRTLDGEAALHVLFYLPRRESELVNKIDAGVVSDVSVGLTPRKALCSACGWDYLGEDAGPVHIFERTCENGHTIGRDGVHLRCHGLDSWGELSLVDQGAAPGASILARPRQALALAASRGANHELLYLRASAEPEPEPAPPPKERKTLMDPEKIIELQASLMVASRDLEAAKGHATALQAALDAEKARAAALEARLAAAEAGDLAKARADLEAASELIDELAKATLVVLGRGGAALPESLAARVELVREGRRSLAALIPPGGRAVDATRDAGRAAPRALDAFRSR